MTSAIAGASPTMAAMRPPIRNLSAATTSGTYGQGARHDDRHRTSPPGAQPLRAVAELDAHVGDVPARARLDSVRSASVADRSRPSSRVTAAQRGQQRGHVAGAGADLQHRLVRLDRRPPAARAPRTSVAASSRRSLLRRRREALRYRRRPGPRYCRRDELLATHDLRAVRARLRTSTSQVRICCAIMSVRARSTVASRSGVVDSWRRVAWRDE